MNLNSPAYDNPTFLAHQIQSTKSHIKRLHKKQSRSRKMHVLIQRHIRKLTTLGEMRHNLHKKLFGSNISPTHGISDFLKSLVEPVKADAK